MVGDEYLSPSNFVMSLPVTISNCFEHIIGLRGLCDGEDLSDSGLYMNEVGISVNELNDFLTEDYQSAESFFRYQKNFAIQIITKEIHTSLQSKYKAATLLQNQRIGFFQDNLNLVAGQAGYYKGFHVELLNCDSFLDLFLNFLSIQLHATQQVDIIIIDLIEGKIIDTLSIDTVSDEIITKWYNKIYKSSRKKLNLFVGYLSTGISSNTTIAYPSNCSSCQGGMNQNSFLRYSAAKLNSASALILENLEGASDTGGLSINYNIACNHTDWLCSVSNIIAMPVLFKTASLIMGWGIRNSGNEQINTRNTVNIDKLKEREEHYEFAYREQMENMMKNINVPSDQRCFVCREKSRTVVMLP